MNNLVLSWCNYTWDQSRIFVKSLRNTGYVGNIVFIEGTQDEFTLSKYKEYNVTVIHGKWEMKYIVNEMFNFLVIYSNEYDKVLLSDVRDVVFQSNPFDKMNSGLHVVTEDLKIKDQYLNSFWISQDFGAAVLEQIENETIICAGTVYGDIYSITKFILNMFMYSPKNHQAIINYLVRIEKLNAIIEPNNGHSLVWTIGTKVDTEHDDFYGIIGHHIVTLGNSVAPSIIHQYDRHPRMKEMLESYYADH